MNRIAGDSGAYYCGWVITGHTTVSHLIASADFPIAGSQHRSWCGQTITVIGLTLNAREPPQSCAECNQQLRMMAMTRACSGLSSDRCRPRLNAAGTLDAVAGFDWISLCTDYGSADGFVAACHGVIARIAPHARVLDVTHAVSPGDVRHGSVVLADTLPWLPPAVHVAVVDPGVGSARRGVALVSGDAVLIGPDNGLLLPAAQALGGVRAAYELVEPAYRLPAVSATFHGRDVFAPAAAHLARAVPPDALGPAVDLASLINLPAPICQVDGDRIRVEVLAVDHFGNVALAAGATELDAAGLRAGAPVTLRWPAGAQQLLVGTTFLDVAQGELILLVDSAGHLTVARRGSSAARHTALHPGTLVELGPR